MTPWGTVSYCTDSVLPGYDTLGSQSRRSIIPRESWNQIFHHISPGVAYPGESNSPDSHTPASLPGVWYPGESVSPGYATRGVNSHFLKLLHSPLKGQCHKNKCGSFFYYKGLYFVFKQKLSGMKSLLTPWGMIPWGVSFFATKIWITNRKLNQIKKYFNPLVIGLSWFELWKNLEVKNLVGLSLNPNQICIKSFCKHYV